MKKLNEKNFNRIVKWLGTKKLNDMITPLMKKVVKDLQAKYKGRGVHIKTTVGPKRTEISLYVKSKSKKKGYVVQYDAEGCTEVLAKVNLVLQHIYNHVME